MSFVKNGSICFLLLTTAVGSLSAYDQFRPAHRWRVRLLEKRPKLLSSIEGTTVGNGERVTSSTKFRSLQAPEKASTNDAAPASAHKQQNTDIPRRVRIAAFDLLLAPTPKKLVRVDEDLLLVALQDLTLSFIKRNFGIDGLLTNRIGAQTTVEYVIFSDIEGNSWSEGQSGHDDPPRTILQCNGGVVSFVGPDIPTENEVNEWVETAINGLLVSTLKKTSYSFVELTQYMSESVSRDAMKPADIVVTLATKTPKPVLAIMSPTPQGENETMLVNVLVSILVVIVIVVLLLALKIRSKNRAVRILCLSSKENEEVIDFSDDSPISISHGLAEQHTKVTNHAEWDRDATEEEERGASDLHNQISVATVQSNDESSSQSTASEFSFPTVSALSFQNPNPFNRRSILTGENFQKEREMALSKDMLYSSWAGKAPSFANRRDRRTDNSVLRSSYFSAKKEQEAVSWMVTNGSTEEGGQASHDHTGLEFAAARKSLETDGELDGLYAVSANSSIRSEAGASMGTKSPRQFGFV